MFAVNADCSNQDLQNLLDYAQRHSPICSAICRAVPVVIERVAN